MFSRISFLLLFVCSIASADPPYVVGELVVLTQTTDAEKTKWVIPEGYKSETLQTRTQLATIPSQSGTMEFLFIEAGEEVTLTRIFIEVFSTPPPTSTKDLSDKKDVDRESPFGAIPVIKKAPARRRSPPITNDPVPILVMYTAPFACPACDKWKKEVHPKLAGKWKYAEEKTGVGIEAFPSFEVRLGNKRSFHKGYLTMDQINTLLEGLK